MRYIDRMISNSPAVFREQFLVKAQLIFMLFFRKRNYRLILNACFLLFLLLGKVSAFATDKVADYPKNGTYTEKIDYLYYFLERLENDSDPADVAIQLDRAESKAREENDREQEYGFRLLKYRHRHHTLNSRKNAELEQELISAINEIDKESYLFLKIFAMRILSDYYWHNLKAYGPSMELELQAYNLYSQIPTAEYPGKFAHMYELASKYYHFKDYNNCKKLLLEACRLQPRYHFPSYDVILNLLGMCYRHQGVYDSAEYYYKEVYKQAPEGSVYKGIASGNLGITYYHQQRYEEAIPLLEEDIDYCLKLHETSNAAISLAVLSDIYFSKKETDKAYALIMQASDLIKKENFWGHYNILEKVYPVMAKIYAARGEQALAYAYADSSLRVKEVLATQKSALILAGAQNVVSAQQHMTEVQQLIDQKKMQILARNSMLAGILLLGTITLLVINRRKIIYRRKQEKLESEKKLLDVELANAGSQLALFTKSIQEKNELIEKFTAGIEQTSAVNEESAGIRVDTLNRLHESTILTDDEWENFRKMFEKVHGGYLDRLKEKLPGLSPAETRFLALSKLKLNNKEMAGTLGISTDAVRMSRHRLRKKLNLPEESTIDELVEEL
jgi:tetratricopeptide (TPR) repeat protein